MQPPEIEYQLCGAITPSGPCDLPHGHEADAPHERRWLGASTTLITHPMKGVTVRERQTTTREEAPGGLFAQLVPPVSAGEMTIEPDPDDEDDWHVDVVLSGSDVPSFALERLAFLEKENDELKLAMNGADTIEHERDELKARVSRAELQAAEAVVRADEATSKVADLHLAIHRNQAEMENLREQLREARKALAEEQDKREFAEDVIAELPSLDAWRGAKGSLQWVIARADVLRSGDRMLLQHLLESAAREEEDPSPKRGPAPEDMHGAADMPWPRGDL